MLLRKADEEDELADAKTALANLRIEHQRTRPRQFGGVEAPARRRPAVPQRQPERYLGNHEDRGTWRHLPENRLWIAEARHARAPRPGTTPAAAPTPPPQGGTSAAWPGPMASPSAQATGVVHPSAIAAPVRASQWQRANPTARSPVERYGGVAAHLADPTGYTVPGAGSGLNAGGRTAASTTRTYANKTRPPQRQHDPGPAASTGLGMRTMMVTNILEDTVKLEHARARKAAGLPADSRGVAASGRTGNLDALPGEEADLSVEERAVNMALLACKVGDVGKLRDAMDAGCHVDQTADGGNSLLLLAAQLGDMRLVKELLRRGANRDYQNDDGQTAAHFCFAYGFHRVGEYLLRKGADEHILNIDRLTCREGLRRNKDGSLQDVARCATG